MTNHPPTADLSGARYARQTLFAPLGVEGQARLRAGRALICGCGALGTVAAETLVRAGVGFVRIVDRDFVELSNLQRQVLFDEQDAAQGLPKAVAAAAKLRAINSQVEIDPQVADLSSANVAALAAGMDVIVDGTDNFETRFLLNDAALAWGLPWIYAGCVGAEGRMLVVLPGETPCLRCLMSDEPPAGALPTCDTAGVLGPAVTVTASLAALEAMKILAGRRAAVNRQMVVIDLWENQLRQFNVANLREAVDCPACRHREFPWLRGERGSQAAVLCGRNAVQLAPSGPGAVSLEAIAAGWAGLGRLTRNPYLVRLHLDDLVLTVFADGRLIVGGVTDVAQARSLAARYLGG